MTTRLSAERDGALMEITLGNFTVFHPVKNRKSVPKEVGNFLTKMCNVRFLRDYKNTTIIGIDSGISPDDINFGKSKVCQGLDGVYYDLMGELGEIEFLNELGYRVKITHSNE